mgnify:CR=1 FL=1
MKNKTVVYKGKVYEINKEYLFFDDNNKLIYGRLKSICKSSFHPFANHHGDPFSSICAFSELKDHGTITPAPVEMINGNAYVFGINDSTYIGFYNKFQKAFFHSRFKGVPVAALEDCTDIREMIVKEGY